MCFAVQMRWQHEQCARRYFSAAVVVNGLVAFAQCYAATHDDSLLLSGLLLSFTWQVVMLGLLPRPQGPLSAALCFLSWAMHYQSLKWVLLLCGDELLEAMHLAGTSLSHTVQLMRLRVDLGSLVCTSLSVLVIMTDFILALLGRSWHFTTMLTVCTTLVVLLLLLIERCSCIWPSQWRAFGRAATPHDFPETLKGQTASPGLEERHRQERYCVAYVPLILCGVALVSTWLSALRNGGSPRSFHSIMGILVLVVVTALHVWVHNFKGKYSAELLLGRFLVALTLLSLLVLVIFNLPSEHTDELVILGASATVVVMGNISLYLLTISTSHRLFCVSVVWLFLVNEYLVPELGYAQHGLLLLALFVSELIAFTVDWHWRLRLLELHLSEIGNEHATSCQDDSRGLAKVLLREHIPLHALAAAIPSGSIVLEQSLARGGLGTVHRARLRGQLVAVRQPALGLYAECELARFVREVASMGALRHPNVVGCHGVLWYPRLMIAMEWMEGGSVWDALASDRILDNHTIISDVARGMAYLHSQGIYHRDLRASNVLLDEADRAKISKFGLLPCDSASEACSGLGTKLWMAPELLDGAEFCDSCDVYSFAIFILELADLSKVHDEYARNAALAEQLLAGMRPDIQWITEDWARLLVIACWAHDPAGRLDFSSIVKLTECVGTTWVNPSAKCTSKSLSLARVGALVDRPLSERGAIPPPEKDLASGSKSFRMSSGQDAPTIILDAQTRRAVDANAAFLELAGYDSKTRVLGNLVSDMVDGGKLRSKDGRLVEVEVLYMSIDESRLACCVRDLGSTQHAMLLEASFNYSLDGKCLISRSPETGVHVITRASLSWAGLVGSRQVRLHDPNFLSSTFSQTNMSTILECLARVERDQSVERTIEHRERWLRCRFCPLVTGEAMMSVVDVSHAHKSEHHELKQASYGNISNQELIHQELQRHVLALSRTSDIVIEIQATAWTREDMRKARITWMTSSFSELFGTGHDGSLAWWLSSCLEGDVLCELLYQRASAPALLCFHCGNEERTLRISTVHSQNLGPHTLLVVCQSKYEDMRAANAKNVDAMMLFLSRELKDNFIIPVHRLVERMRLTLVEHAPQLLQGSHKFRRLLDEVSASLERGLFMAMNQGVALELANGLYKPKPVEVDLGSALRNTVGSWAEVTIAANAPGYVRLDGNLMSFVLVHLVTNAVKYGETDGEVTVHIARACDGRLRFEVTNMPGEMHSELRKRHGDGNAVKAIAQKLSRSHVTGGLLSVLKSTRLMDAEFELRFLADRTLAVVSLPIANDEMKQVALDDFCAVSIVDDNVARLAEQKVFDALGMTVHFFDHEAKGLGDFPAFVAGLRPRRTVAFICELLHYPGTREVHMGGIELVSRIRKAGYTGKLFVKVSRMSLDERECYRRAGADGTISVALPTDTIAHELGVMLAKPAWHANVLDESVLSTLSAQQARERAHCFVECAQRLVCEIGSSHSKESGLNVHRLKTIAGYVGAKGVMMACDALSTVDSEGWAGAIEVLGEVTDSTLEAIRKLLLPPALISSNCEQLSRSELETFLSSSRREVAAVHNAVNKGRLCKVPLSKLAELCATVGVPRLEQCVLRCQRREGRLSHEDVKEVQDILEETVEALELQFETPASSFINGRSIPRASPVREVEVSHPVVAVLDSVERRPILEFELFPKIDADLDESFVFAESPEDLAAFEQFVFGRIDHRGNPRKLPHRQADIVVVRDRIRLPHGHHVRGGDLIDQLREGGYCGVSCIVCNGLALSSDNGSTVHGYIDVDVMVSEDMEVSELASSMLQALERLKFTRAEAESKFSDSVDVSSFGGDSFRNRTGGTSVTAFDSLTTGPGQC